jgi:hypothetical protein
MLGVQLLDIRASLLDAVDLRGVPFVENGITRWATPEFLPRDDGSQGILFFDELNRAPMMVQNALLQLALDRKLGEYTLPDGWSIVAAGNPESHRGVTKMSEALAPRFIHASLDEDCDEWTLWACNNNIRPEIVAFIRFRPNLLHAYDKASTEKAYPSPRSWEFASQIMNANPDSSIELSLYSGTVGSAAAGELLGFMEIYRNLPSLDGILMNPGKAKVPDELSVLYAVTSGLASKATDTNFDRVMLYLERLPREFAVYCVKDATSRDETLCNTPCFIKFAAENKDIMG